MARYTGPVFKKSRRYGFSILESGKEFAKGKSRTTPPGVHGASKRKMSDYGLHLNEKQKVRYMYGVNERQFRNTFEKAKKNKHFTAGMSMLLTLESRLDNIVYRMGWAPTRRAARQLVTHGHILLDGKKADIASINVKVGQSLSIKPTSRDVVSIQASIDSHPAAAWLTRDKQVAFEGKYDRFPERTELNKDIDEGLIVEFYSK